MGTRPQTWQNMLKGRRGQKILGNEPDVFAEIVSTSLAEEALFAGDTGFYSHPVT